jgi:hypothetical protein
MATPKITHGTSTIRSPEVTAAPSGCGRDTGLHQTAPGCAAGEAGVMTMWRTPGCYPAAACALARFLLLRRSWNTAAGRQPAAVGARAADGQARTLTRMAATVLVVQDGPRGADRRGTHKGHHCQEGVPT